MDLLSRLTRHLPLTLAVLALIVLVIVIALVLLVRRRRVPPAEEAPAPVPAGTGAVVVDFRQAGSHQRLAAAFRRALAELRRHLGAGDSRYRLPWYVLLGEEASGKSSLFPDSGLNLPLGAPAEPSPDSGEGVAFWFFDHGVVLDVAGEYVLGAGGGTPNERGWRHFLSLLRENRPERPLDGVVLAIPCAELAGPPEAEGARLAAAAEKGAALFRRLRQAQESLGMNFPVYILVTGCERVPGFESYVAEIPDHLRGDLFGWSNPYTPETAYRPEWIDEAFTLPRRRAPPGADRGVRRSGRARGSGRGLLLPRGVPAAEGGAAGLPQPDLPRQRLPRDAPLPGALPLRPAAAGGPRRRAAARPGSGGRRGLRARRLRPQGVPRARPRPPHQPGAGAGGAPAALPAGGGGDPRPDLDPRPRLGPLPPGRAQGRPAGLPARHLAGPGGDPRPAAEGGRRTRIPARQGVPPVRRHGEAQRRLVRLGVHPQLLVQPVQPRAQAGDRPRLQRDHPDHPLRGARAVPGPHPGHLAAGEPGGRGRRGCLPGGGRRVLPSDRFIAWDPGTAEVPAADLRPLERTPEFTRLSGYVGSLRALETHVGLFNRLRNTESLQDLNAVVHTCSSRDLPKGSSTTAQLYARALADVAYNAFSRSTRPRTTRQAAELGATPVRPAVRAQRRDGGSAERGGPGGAGGRSGLGPAGRGHRSLPDRPCARSSSGPSRSSPRPTSAGWPATTWSSAPPGSS